MVVLVEFQWFMILYGDWEWFYGSFSGISVIYDIIWAFGIYNDVMVVLVEFQWFMILYGDL